MIATTKKNYIADNPNDLRTNALTKLLTEDSTLNSELIKNALNLSALTGENHATPTGESCYNQGLSIAKILHEIDVDSETLAAGILYSSAKYADLKGEDILEHFGNQIEKLVHNTKQMASISDLYHETAKGPEQRKHNLDNIRKMLLAMVDDIRVVLIKLAERLVVLRRMAIFDPIQRQEMAKEIMAVYAPLANRLGLTPIKWEMEDLSFRYLDPEEYQKIANFLRENRTQRETYVQEIITTIKELLNEENITNYKIYGRAKHIYSFYRKMQRKKVGPEEIYDATAVRVLVNSIEDCYKVLSCIHANWKHVQKEFDDYVATPKPNGYRSIHTVIIGPNDKMVEIQIRTTKMHEEAELGGAAHWIYKETEKSKARAQTSYEAKIAWLRQVMEWQKEVTSKEQELSDAKDIFNDRVYVFTPNGDIFDLPQGATPLDLAYHIHSELGHRCRGAKIDNSIVPLHYQLKTGDHVEILTTKHGGPSRDWLNPALKVLNTSRAKSKVLHWFKKQNYNKNSAIGHDLLDNEAKRLNIKIPNNLSKIANSLNFKSSEDLYAALGACDVKIGTIINAIAHDQKITLTKSTNIEASNIISTAIAQPQKIEDFEIQGIDNLLTHIAQCCKPIPGDAIIGYITQGKGVSIHRQDCHNISSALKDRPERLIKISWGEKIEHRYPVDLNIVAFDRQGIIRDITAILSEENIVIRGLTSRIDPKENLGHINLTIEINSLDSLSSILNKINMISNVLEVKRNG